MMNNPKSIYFGILLGICVSGSAFAASRAKSEAKGKPFAHAVLSSKSGSTAVGTVSFVQNTTGIEVTANVNHAAPGLHGFHIHEKGDCSAPDASSAGGHFNPLGHKHGKIDQTAAHVGDLGNITIGADGSGKLQLKLTTSKSGFSDWNALVGKSVILHEKEDDLKTDPTGNAGGRIACGVIEASDKTAALP